MNIRSLQSKVQPISTSKVGSAIDAFTPASGSASEDSQASKSPAAGDRVELSAAARAKSARTEELDQAKKAYGNLPPLSPERRETILARVQEGYYSQPDIIGIIAERLEANLTGREPEM